MFSNKFNDSSIYKCFLFFSQKSKKIKLLFILRFIFFKRPKVSSKNGAVVGVLNFFHLLKMLAKYPPTLVEPDYWPLRFWVYKPFKLEVEHCWLYSDWYVLLLWLLFKSDRVKLYPFTLLQFLTLLLHSLLLLLTFEYSKDFLPMDLFYYRLFYFELVLIERDY